jgi:uncharacterized protein YfaS (alpha-2-macroglobulin family)
MIKYKIITQIFLVFCVIHAEQLTVETNFVENPPGTRAPLYITFSEPMITLGYPPDSVPDKPSFSPSVSGKWSWYSQIMLQFIPDEPWPNEFRYFLEIPEDCTSPVSDRHFKKHFTKTIYYGSFIGEFTSEDSLILTTDSVLVWFSLPVHPDSLLNHLAGFDSFEITNVNKTTYAIKARNGWPSGKRITLSIDSGLTPLGGNIPLDSNISTSFVANDSLICLGLFRNWKPVSPDDSLYLEDQYTIQFNRNVYMGELCDYMYVNGKPYSGWIHEIRNRIGIKFVDSSTTCTILFNAGMPSYDGAFLFNDVRYVLKGAFNRIDSAMPPFLIKNAIVKYSPHDSLPSVSLTEKKPIFVTPSMKVELIPNVQSSHLIYIHGDVVLHTPGSIDTLDIDRWDSLLFPAYYFPPNVPCTLVVRSGFRFGDHQLKSDFRGNFTTGNQIHFDTCQAIRFCDQYHLPQVTLLPEKPAIPLEVFGNKKIITAIRNVPVSEVLKSYDSTRFLPHQWHYDTITNYQKSPDSYSYVPVPLGSALSDQGRGNVEVLSSIDGLRFDTAGIFTVTDLGIRLFYGRFLTAVSVSSLTKRAPVSGASVFFYNQAQRVLASGKTDASGLFKVPDRIDIAFVMAAFETDTLIMDIYRKEQNCDTILNKGIVFTERPLYRPGDTLFFKGFLRKLSDHWIPVKNDSVIVSIAWEGAPEFSDTLPLVGLGSFSGKISVPLNIKQKGYEITVYQLNTHVEFLNSFNVKEFRASELTGTVGIGRIEKDSVFFPVSARWLHGGAAPGCAVSYAWNVEQREYYGDSYTTSSTIKHNISFSDSGSATLDSNGSGIISCKRLLNDSGAVYCLTAEITGSPVHTVQARNVILIPFSNRPLIRFYLRPDEHNTCDDTLFIKTTLQDGSVIQKRTIDITIFKQNLEKRKIKNHFGLPAFVRDTTWAIIMSKRMMTDAAGISCIKLSTLSPGDYKIKSVPSACNSTDTFSYDFKISEPPWRYTRSQDGVTSFQDKDTLSIIDPHKFAVGDTVRISLRTRRDSCVAALAVRRENLYEYKWIRMTGRDTIIKFVIKDEYIPAVRIDATFLPSLWRNSKGLTFNQPEGYTTLGVTVDVSDTSRTIPICISTDSAAFAPGDSVTVHLAIPSKYSSATALVMVVDEGVLKCANDRLPTFESTFTMNRDDCNRFENVYSFRCFHGSFNYDSSKVLKLKPERLRGERGSSIGHGYGAGFGGSGYDDIDDLIGYMLGGDGGGSSDLRNRSRKNTSIRDRILPCACFNPDVKFDSNGKAMCRFKLPGNLTRWRITAIVDDTTSFGVDTASFVTNKPLMVRPQLPRFLRVGDSASAQYILENRSKDNMSIKSGTFTSKDTTLDSCNVPSNSTRFCNFPLTGHVRGTDSILFLTRGGSFLDGIKVDIPVIDEHLRMVQAIGGSTIDNVQIPVLLPEKASVKNCSLGVALSTTRMQNLQEGVRYLFEYPYGCLEQQGSRIMPLLCMKSFTERFKLPMLQYGDEKIVIQKYLDNIGTYQNLQDGGLTYWPSNSGKSYPWITAYVLEILIRAKKLGYKVCDSVYTRAINFVNSDLKHEYTEDQQRLVTKSYETLVLSLAGKTNLSEMKHLYEIRNSLPLTARIDLLKAISASGKNKRCMEVIQRSLRNKLVERNRLAYFVSEESKGLEFCHESPVRQTALCLEALLETGARSRFDEPMVRWLTEQRQAGRWRTTQENIAVFRAFAAYTSVYEHDEPVLNAVVKLARDLWFTTDLRGREGVQAYRSKLLDSIPVQGKTAISIDRSGSGRLYYDLLLSKSTSDTAPAYSSGLAIKRTISLLTDTARLLADTSQLQNGQCLQVELRIRCDQDIAFVAIDDPVPAGCEAVDPELVTGEQTKALEITHCYGPQSPVYNEFRDSRVLYFYNDMPAGEYKIKYLLKPTTAGRFLWPAPKAEAMYFPEISGKGTARMVTIK